MKVISLWEPWATLMAISAKRIETRGWDTCYRGPVAIHATLGGLTDQDLYFTCCYDPFRLVLMNAGILKPAMSARQVRAAFPRGKIIAVGELVDCAPTAPVICRPGVFEDWKTLDTEQEREFGNYKEGRFGLVFDKMRSLSAHIPFKSRQGKLLDLPADIKAMVEAQIV